MIKKITLLYLFFGFFACMGFRAYSQINFSTPSIAFTQACASSSFNSFNFSFSFFPATGLQPGNQFIVELSNSTGSFASPTVVKVLTNTTSPVSSNFSLPTTAYGEGYRIRVRSTAPVKVSNPSNAFAAYYAIHNQPFAINSNVGTASICEGQTYTLQIDNTGTPASPVYYPSLQYTWYKNFAEIPGQTGPSLTVSEAGSYYVIVDYGTCVLNSYSNIVQVQIMGNLTPAITSQDNATIICPGNTNTLTSSLTSSTYTYQWYRDNTAIPGATGTTYAAGEGGLYHLAVANGPCIFESDAILLEEIDFNLTVDPATTTTVIPGENVTLTAIDDSSAPAYQWFKDNIVIAGANLSTYAATEAGTYKVTVTESAPCLITKESQVTLAYPLSIDLAIQPNTYNACTSNAVTLEIASFDANTTEGIVNLIGNGYGYTYQWYRNDVAVAGANASQILINDGLQNGFYKLAITAGGFGDIVSNTFEVNLALDPVSITGNTTLCDGGTVALTANVNDPGYSYQWYKDGAAIAGGTLPTLSATTEGDFYVIVTGGTCTEQSNTITIQSADITVAATAPLTDVILPGETRILSVTTDALGATYSWTRNGVALSENTGSLSATQDGEYIVTVTQTIGCAVTEELTFSLEYPTGFNLVINTAAGYTACTSSSATLQTASFIALTTEGNMDVSAMAYAYQWYKNDVAIAGATTSTLNLTSALQNGVYRLGVTIPDFGAIFSNNVTINLAVEAIAISNDTDLCAGSTVALTSAVTDAGYTYQWYKDNVAIAGATTFSYTANAEGDYYVAVTGGLCSAQSNTISLTITEIIVNSTSPLTDVVIHGQTKTFTVTTDAQGPAYSWTRNGVTLGETSATLTATQDGEYIVTVTQTVGCNDTEQKTFTLEYPTGYTLAVAPTAGYTACTSASATLGTTSFIALTIQGNVDVISMPYSYQWYKNDIAISGATSATLSLNSAVQNGTYKLGVTVPDFGTVFSNAVVINLAVEAVAINNNTVLCAGSDVLLTSTVNNGTYSYQWYKDSVAISGAVAPLYSANAEGDYYLEVTSGTCSTQSNTINLTIAEITVSTTSQMVDVILPGETKTLSVTTDAQVPTYSWTRDGIATGNTTPTLNATEDGEYIVTVIQTSGCSATAQQTFTLEYPSSYTLTAAAAAGYNSCVSASTTLQATSFIAATIEGNVDVSAMGYALQWYKNNVAVSGAVSPTLALSGADQNGIYKLGATIPGVGIVYSNDITINLALPAVTITNNTELCAGGNVILTSNINNPAYTYQWYKNGVLLAGATTPAITVTTEGDYNVIVTGGACNSASNTITLSIGAITANSTAPDTDVILPGQTVAITVTTDALAPTYSWTRNGVAIAATTATINATQDGEYIVTVTQTTGCNATVQKAFTLIYPSAFDATIATNGAYTACTSASANLQMVSFTATTIEGVVDVSAMGYALQWYKNNVPVAGATTATLAINSSADNGEYKLSATVPGFATIFSNNIVVELGIPTVTITNNTGLCAGSDVLISANITGAAYTYQWYKEGIALSGAMSSTFTANAEGAYHVEVSSGSCSAVSNTINLAIASITVSSTTPDNGVILPGGNIAINTTTDAQSPTYSWNRNGVLLADTTASLNATQDGEYIVTVTQNAGCAATAQKTFTLAYPTSFDVTAAVATGYSACTSTSASIEMTSFTATTLEGVIDITAQGYALQWYRNDVAVPGATSSVINISTATQNGDYKLGATVPGFGIIYSNTIAIQLSLPAITINNNTVLCEGSDVILSADINNVVYSYQWYKDGIALAGANGFLYTASEEGSYYVEISAGSCTTTSNTLALSVAVITVSSSVPDVDLILPGEVKVLTVTTNAIAPTYSWSLDGSAITGTTNTTNATAEGEYTVTVQQTSGCTASAQKTFVLQYPTGFNLSIAAAATDCSSTTANLNLSTFTATTTDGDVDVTTMGYAYQWYRNGVAVSGANAASISLTDVSQNGDYTLVATVPGSAPVVSNLITINLSPGIINITSAGSLCPGSPSVAITPNITDTAYTYTWYKDGVEVASGSTAAFTATLTGNYYVIVNTGTCTYTSNTVTVGENDFELTTGNNLVDYIIPGEGFNLSVSTDALMPTFQWYRNGVLMPGETSPTLSAALDGEYKVVATQTQDCVMSKEIIFTLEYPTDFEIQIGAGDYIACNSSTAVLSVIDFSAATPFGPVDIIGDSYNYQWYLDGTAVAGANTNLHEATQSGVYYLEVEIPGIGTIQSNTVTLQLAFVADVTITADGSLCGGNVTLISDVMSPLYTYKWYSQASGDVLGTGVSLTVTEPGSYYVAVFYQSCIITSNILEVESTDMSQVTIDAASLTTITEGSVAMVTATGADTYEWFFNNVPFATGATVTVNDAGNYSVVATIGDCTVTRSFILATTRNEVLAIPNVVTPNNDGYNDKWSLPAEYLNNPDVEIIIYGSKGNIVFRGSSYNNTWPETDFDYPLNNPVFYYTIMENLEITKRGSITLIK